MKLALSFLLALLLASCGGPHPGFPGAGPSTGRTSPAPAEGGGSSDVGSAGDNAGPDHDAAWFVGRDRAIDVCYEIAPDFGFDEKAVGGLISAVFGNWAFYVHQHKVYAREWPHLQLSVDHVSVRQGCSRPADLAIYLGVENDQVRKYRAQFLDPTAFIQRLSYEKLPPWGKGFIWVAKQGGIRASPVFPNWAKPGALAGILMHEVGHTYGNEHIPGTIMAADVSQLLKTDDLNNFVNIDRCRELAPCPSCFYSRSFEAKDLEERATRALKHLWGRDAEDGTITLARGSTTDWDLLTIRDKKGYLELTFDPVYNEQAHAQVSGLAVFKVAYGDYVSSIPDVSFVEHTALYQNQRKVGFADIETNLAACTGDDRNGRTPVSISLIENDELLPLASFTTQTDVEHGRSPLISTDVLPLPPRFP